MLTIRKTQLLPVKGAPMTLVLSMEDEQTDEIRIMLGDDRPRGGQFAAEPGWWTSVRPTVFGTIPTSMAGDLCVDLAHAVAARVVQVMIGHVAPSLPTCETIEVAQEELKRTGEVLLAFAGGRHDVEEGLVKAASEYVAAMIRLQAVRW